MVQPHAVSTAFAGAVGVLLGAVVAGVAVLRQAKPLHPRGEVVTARLELDGDCPELGSALGSAGSHEALVRFSSGGGLPRGWPDVQGLAVRWTGDAGRPQDLLLGSAGTGRWGRFVLTVRRERMSGSFSTLMPFRGPAGAVMVAAVPTPGGLLLQRAGLTGAWRPFGRLRLRPVPGKPVDAPVRFDPVLHSPTGLESYPWAARLRARPYRWARRAYQAGTAPAPVTGQTRPGEKASV
ncbi:hypothetical protein PU560_06730 [Georgenia sp. 10Sc9-8]|uniref:Phosphodiesterase n=1 Tax=Georgenia halotolerans TaxID=3028317 RepID=A0ABT5TVS5_9MICO|nr:hypothetical protein [Georgenia halotolerans]